MLLTSGAIAESWSFTPKGKAFPLVIGIILLALLILKLVSLFSPRLSAKVDIHGLDLPSGMGSCDLAERKETEGKEPKAVWPTELAMVAWLVLLMGLVYLLGFVQSVPIFLLSFLKVQGKHSWRASLILAAGVSVFVWVLFVLLLDVPFPEGMLGLGGEE